MGYGTFNEVKQMTAREVIQALNYEKFCNDYKAVAIEKARQ